MSDYISRVALVDRLNKNLSACNPGTFSEMCYADAIETVKHFPAADVEPVRHGRWVNIGGFPACSECACSPAVWEPKPNNPKGFPEWCYGFGAKMDLEDENHVGR